MLPWLWQRHARDRTDCIGWLNQHGDFALRAIDLMVGRAFEGYEFGSS